MKQTLLHEDASIEVTVDRLAKDRFRVVVDDEEHEIVLEESLGGQFTFQRGERSIPTLVSRNKREIFLTLAGRDYRFGIEGGGGRKARRHEHHEGEVSLPMPGVVVQVYVKQGERVTKGQPLLVVEAMKMEHTLRAPRDGTVTHLVAKEGEMVDAGSALLEVTA